MTWRYGIILLAACLGANALAAPPTLKGTVKNVTTGKPAAGDEVMLMSLARGAAELGRTKTDGGGHFSFTVPAGHAVARLVRVLHQGVDYGAVAEAGVDSVAVQVYDAARTLDSITAAQHVQRYQTEGDTLQVIEEIVVRNASNPPRTLVNDRPFELQLPPEAEIVAGGVQIGGAQPLRRKPSPGGQKGQYYFPNPLRPGDTRFAVAYRLPYRGEATIVAKIPYPVQQLAVVLPKTMKLEAKTPGMFQPKPDETRANVQVTGAVKPGQPLAFRVTGTGKLVPEAGGERRAQGGQPVTSGAAPKVRTESKQSNVGWFVLGGLALVLAAGAAGFVANRRKQPRHVSA